MSSVAQRVRVLREQHLVLDQGELAEKLGVSRATVNGWENSRNEPRPKQLRALAKLAGVDVRFFYEEAA